MSDAERREHFKNELRNRLEDAGFRNQEGFPSGTIDSIIEMSDPPYYTACPNPFLADVIAHHGRTYDGEIVPVHEPFAADVTEGKNDPIYNAHSYHTKVPPRAIEKFVRHYSRPGDVVLDAFCGTGMTGVASGTVGDRTTLLVDLSPIATFIASNLNKHVDARILLDAAEAVVEKAERQAPDLYSTAHNGWKVRDRKRVKNENSVATGELGRIEFVLYSDVVSCPNCAHSASFYEIAVDPKLDALRDKLTCPSCSAAVPEKAWTDVREHIRDPLTGENIARTKITPVLINYTYRGSRYEKKPDQEDHRSGDDAVHRIQHGYVPDTVLIRGKETQRNLPKGISRIHHFFTTRELAAVSLLMKEIKNEQDFGLRQTLLFALTACLPYASRMRRFRADRKGGGPLSGTLYVGSMVTPPNVFQSFLRNAAAAGVALAANPRRQSAFITTQSATNLSQIPDASIDYIFLDPPFGYNFDYSELNFFWEAFLGVITDQAPEAIISSSQEKGLDTYRDLLTKSFRELHRALKPGRWMTVEFSNTQASVWNSIQVALQEAGFVVSNVSALDKKQNSFKAVMTTTAVKQDLIISAYKPNGGLEDRFKERGAVPESAWDFVQTHLQYLPVVKKSASNLLPIPERDPRRVFDRMVAWFVKHDMPVPLSSGEFLSGLEERFPIRDGMAFLPTQVDDYDRQRLAAGQAPQLELFVDDERSAIDWLTEFLKRRPATYQEAHPEFTRQIGAGWRKHEQRPELQQLLEDNFLQYAGSGPVPPQIHGYLSSNWKELRNLDKSDPILIAKAKGRWYVPDPAKQQDVEKRREKSLLREFEVYRDHRGRKLKEVRLEALRAGFKAAWANRDYQTIIEVADKVTEDAWQEDEKLLTFYDMAETRLRASK